MMLFKNAVFMTAAACGLLACAWCAGSSSSTAAPPNVKPVNELDESSNFLNIKVGDQPLPNVETGSESPYVDVVAGAQDVTGYAYVQGLEYFPSTTVNVAVRSTYTLIAMGSPSEDVDGTIPIMTVLANDDHAAPSSGNALVRYVSCAFNDPPYSVWVNGTTVLKNAH